MLATLGIIQSSRPSVPLLLDTYTGAAIACSTRKLSSNYIGSAIRVRRSNDNTEQDIGFNGNNLNESTLTSFVGSNSAYITTIYDQSGNTKNITQTTSGSQPRIINVGTIDKLNNKPAIYFDGITYSLQVTSSTTYFKFLHDGTKSMINITGKIGNSINPNAPHTFIDNTNGTTGQTGIYAAYYDVSPENNRLSLLVTRGVGGQPAINVSSNNVLTPNIQFNLSILLDASNSTASNRAVSYFNNGSSFGNNTATNTPSSNNATNNLLIGRFYGGEHFVGYMQEILIFNTDQSSNRSGIESNINTYYSIY